MEMASSSTPGKSFGLASNQTKRDASSHSLDSLSRMSYHRAQPNEYGQITHCQASLNEPLANATKNEGDPYNEHRTTEMTDSDGLCTSESYTASSELSESKYDESPMPHPTHVIPRLSPRYEQRKDHYLDEQKPRKRIHKERPQTSSTNKKNYTSASGFYYDPEKSSMSREFSCDSPFWKYENYSEENRDMSSRDSRNRNLNGSLDNPYSMRRSSDRTLYSAGRSRTRDARKQKSSLHDNYRHRNRKLTPSPNSDYCSTDTSLSCSNRRSSHGLNSTTTLARYANDSQTSRRYHRDTNRHRRKRQSHRSSAGDLFSVVRVNRKQRSSDQPSISSELESDCYSRQTGQRPYYDRNETNKGDPDLRKQRVRKLNPSKNQLRDEPSNLLATHLEIIDDFDVDPLYRMATRKLIGPASFGLLVLIMLLSLGLAIYFSLGRAKEAEFSTANIRLRILNSTLGENLNFLSRPTFGRLSSGYCRQMDRFYLRSHFKKRYRGCEVISFKRQFINFTLYFSEKDISNKQVESVIKRSANAVDNPDGTRVAVINNFEIQLSDIKIVISETTEEVDFNKTQPEVTTRISQTSQPTTSQPNQKSERKFKKPPKNKNKIKMNKNKNAVHINNIGDHLDEEDRPIIRKVHHKIFVTSNATKMSTIPTIIKAIISRATTTIAPTQTMTTKRKTTPTTTIIWTEQIGRNIDNNDRITTNVSSNPLQNGNSDVMSDHTGSVTSLDYVNKSRTLLKVNKDIPLPDPCKTRKTGELIPHVVFCDKFYQCVYGTGIIQSCQQGTWFDPKLKVCSLKPKDAECTPSYKIEDSTFGSSTEKLTAMARNSSPPKHSPSLFGNAARMMNDSFLFAANFSPADIVNKIPKMSTNQEGTTQTQMNKHIGNRLKNASWESTSHNRSQGSIQEPCTASLGDEYHPHPNGCHHFLQCVNGKPEPKSCPDDFVFDFQLTSCVRKTNGFVCPDFFPCKRNENRNYYPHPYHCHLYIQCEFGHEKTMSCAHGLVFNPIVNTCTIKPRTNDWKCPEEHKGNKNEYS